MFDSVGDRHRDGLSALRGLFTFGSIDHVGYLFRPPLSRRRAGGRPFSRAKLQPIIQPPERPSQAPASPSGSILDAGS
jgi:hypothetical protein